MADLVEHGRVIRGWLGVGTQTLSPDQARALGLQNTYGIILTTIAQSSPAERAGLKPNDVITHVNDEPVLVWQDALRSIAAMRPGTKVVLSGSRQGQPFRVQTEIAERPPRIQ
jgi:serine protease DegS